jgi:glutathione S-transferase
MLEEVGAPYRTELLDYSSSMKSPAYLAVNPMGKVPAIRHGKVVVTEAAAICAYLADAFPQARLAPPSDQRGDYYRWLFFAAGPFEQAWSNHLMGFRVPPDRERAMGYGTYALAVDALERAVEGRDHVAGEAFSAADVYVGSQIGFGMQFGALERRPAFEAYWNRVSSRPAAKRAIEIDDDLAAKAAAAT